MKTLDQAADLKLSTQRRGRPSLLEQQSRVDTRSGLMQAAGELMIAKDSIDISLSEIAEKTGLSPALVQYHFGSKEGLLMALAERDAVKAVEQLRELGAMNLPTPKKLRMHIGGLVNAYYKAPYINRLLQALMQNKDSAAARRVSEIFVQPIADFQRGLLEQGLREGVFREVDPMHFYFMLIGACDHLFARRCALAHVFGVHEVTEEIKRGYIQSLVGLVMRGVMAD